MKNNNKKQLVIKNLLYGFGSKFVIMLLGIVIPRIVIISFGSELNGFLATITQIFTYFALLEAGIGNSTVNALFEPLEEENYFKANNVLSQARRYYRKASAIYLLLIIIFSIIYPEIVSSDMSKSLMRTVIILQGLPNVITYYFCAVYEQLLMADGKRYVSENVMFFLHCLISLSKIILIYNGFSIIIVQCAYLGITLLKIPIMYNYCKIHYSWMYMGKNVKENLLKERTAFLIHEISSTIFYNTDAFIISTFCGFKYASIYVVYNMIYSALNSLVNTANGGLGFVLGRNLNKPKQEFEIIYDIYNIIYTMVVFIVFTTATTLTIPFISIYTKGVEDVNYIIFGLPILFGITNIMSGARAIPARLITVTGHAKNTQNRSVYEMILNIAVSILLVKKFNIYGVLIGTMIALLYRMNDIIIYANKYILKRKPMTEYKNLFVNLIIYFSMYTVSAFLNIKINSYLGFMIIGMVYILVISFIYLVINTTLNHKIFAYVINKYLIHNKKAN